MSLNPTVTAAPSSRTTALNPKFGAKEKQTEEKQVSEQMETDKIIDMLLGKKIEENPASYLDAFFTEKSAETARKIFQEHPVAKGNQEMINLGDAVNQIIKKIQPALSKLILLGSSDKS